MIFYSLIKPVMNDKGEREMDIISVSQALQIAGRAGRYGTQYDKVSVLSPFFLFLLYFLGVTFMKLKFQILALLIDHFKNGKSC